MFVGNDLVNLKAVHNQGKHHQPRWLNKVFNAPEIKSIYEAKDPHTELWLLWACKESAYKVWIKNNGAPFLNARRIEIFEKESTNGSCRWARIDHWQSIIYPEITESWIHTICLDNANANISPIHCLPEKIITRTNQSQNAIYQLARQRIAIHFQIPLPLVAISKNNTGVPSVHIAGHEIKIDISFSHDYPYSAFTYLRA